MRFESSRCESVPSFANSRRVLNWDSSIMSQSAKRKAQSDRYNYNKSKGYVAKAHSENTKN
jgi:hypothetical protein